MSKILEVPFVNFAHFEVPTLSKLIKSNPSKQDIVVGVTYSPLTEDMDGPYKSELVVSMGKGKTKQYRNEIVSGVSRVKARSAGRKVLTQLVASYSGKPKVSVLGDLIRNRMESYIYED